MKETPFIHVFIDDPDLGQVPVKVLFSKMKGKKVTIEYAVDEEHENCPDMTGRKRQEINMSLDNVVPEKVKNGIEKSVYDEFSKNVPTYKTGDRK